MMTKPKKSPSTSPETVEVVHTESWDLFLGKRKVKVILTITVVAAGAVITGKILAHIRHSTRNPKEAKSLGEALEKELTNKGLNVKLIEAMDRIGNHISFFGWRADFWISVKRRGKKIGPTLEKIASSMRATLHELPFQRFE